MADKKVEEKVVVPVTVTFAAREGDESVAMRLKEVEGGKSWMLVDHKGRVLGFFPQEVKTGPDAEPVDAAGAFALLTVGPLVAALYEKHANKDGLPFNPKKFLAVIDAMFAGNLVEYKEKATEETYDGSIMEGVEQFAAHVADEAVAKAVEEARVAVAEAAAAVEKATDGVTCFMDTHGKAMLAESPVVGDPSTDPSTDEKGTIADAIPVVATEVSTDSDGTVTAEVAESPTAEAAAEMRTDGPVNDKT